ncbi:MAG: sulfite exporter TauE/SafE family protein [Alphaproteobacteria bacterium]
MSFLLLPYHLGRMTTYVTLAVLVSGFINLAFIFSDLKILISAPLLMFAGIIFLVSAFPALRTLFPWAVHLRIGLPARWVQRLQKALPYKSDRPTLLKRYMLGVLLGFMPCGLVISALLASASAADTIQAAAAMAAFAAGTMPALILTALGGQALQGRYPAAAARLSQGAMLVSGLWLFALAGSMLL